jgi:GrpB-like predicted nucleotidyltransferase (UPF0157 family)
MSRIHRPYELAPYNPDWVLQFEQEAQVIRDLMGSSVIAIEHIGSTSVPGLMAKPQIDILVVVENLVNVPEFYDVFLQRGYVSRGREYVGNDDDYITKDAPDGRRLVSIHIFAKDSPQIPMYVEFRNYLRTHDEERKLYMDIKQSLYQKYRDNYAAYDSEKGPLLKPIIERAHMWAMGLDK